MEDYGFALVPQEEARKMGLPNATGLFEELFDSMVQEVAKDKRKEVDYGTALSLTREEKRISFMNRYFMFKKMRNVNAEKIAKIVMHRQEEDEDAEDDSHDGQSSKEETSKVKVPVFRKIKGKKIVLTEGSKPSASAPDPTNNSLANVGITFGKTVSIRVKKPVQKPEDKK